MHYGFASNLRDAMSNASFIGFTYTPVEKTDANKRAIFGEYISIYNIQRAVADKATVPSDYDSRNESGIPNLALNASELPKLDAEFEEIRGTVKRILNNFGYPPDIQDEAVKAVLFQAEVGRS